MDAWIEFIFRNKLYKGEMFIDDSEDPCLVFIILNDDELISEFGDEIILKTDFENLLPKRDDYPALLELRKDLFAMVRNTEAFQVKKLQRATSNSAKR
jgi:hypothetical protein